MTNGVEHRAPVAWSPPTSQAICEIMARAGLRRTGPLSTVRRWELSLIVRCPTARGEVYFKAVPPVFAHEGRLTAWLARWRPEAVPAVIAAGEGWLLMEELPASRRRVQGHPLEAHARLQRESIARLVEIRSLGCGERSLAQLASTVGALRGREGLLSDRSADRLERLCAEVDRLGLPLTLVHGDVHLGNCRWTGSGWVVFDWTDAAITHPFIDLAQPLFDGGSVPRHAVLSLYGAAWSDVAPEGHIAHALRTAPAIGAAHHIATHLMMIEQLGVTADLESSLRMWARRLDAALEALSREGTTSTSEAPVPSP